MVKNLTVILLLLGNISFAQLKPKPTQFDKFVRNSNIEWAAYASDTFNFDNADFNNLLLSRMAKHEIKGSLPVQSRTADANHIKYLSLDSINSIFHFGTHQPANLYDSLGNIVEQERTLPNIDTSTFNLTEITQILYIEKGKLKSYIPFVTPTVPLFISTGRYIGERFYFNTCYNYKYSKKPHKKDQLIFLSQTKKIISLEAGHTTDKLKEMYGKNLLETLWPYVLENKIAAFSAENNTKLNLTELEKILTTDYITVPVWDSTNAIYKFETMASANKQMITGIQLVQDWFYDTKRNKVSNTINEVYLFVKMQDIDGKENKPSARLKLVFQ